MAAPHPRDVSRFVRLHPLSSESRQQTFIVAAAQRRMRLFRRPKIVLYAKMDLDSPAGEPATATHRQFGWFRDFRHAEQFAKKVARARLATFRHRELDVIDLEKWIFRHAPITRLSRLR